MPSYTNPSGIPLRLPWLKPSLAIPHHQYLGPYTDKTPHVATCSKKFRSNANAKFCAPPCRITSAEIYSPRFAALLAYARSRWPMPDHCEKALYAGTSNLRLHGSRTPQCALRALLRHIQAISLMRPHSVLYHVPDRFYAAMVQTAQALLSIVLCHNFEPFREHLLRPTAGGASVAGPDKDQSALVK